MNKHETRETYERMIDEFLARSHVTKIDMNIRTMTPTQMKRAIRNDDANFNTPQNIRAVDMTMQQTQMQQLLTSIL